MATSSQVSRSEYAPMAISHKDADSSESGGAAAVPEVDAAPPTIDPHDLELSLNSSLSAV